MSTEPTESHLVQPSDPSDQRAQFAPGTRIFAAGGTVYVIQQAFIATATSSVNHIQSGHASQMQGIADESQIPSEAKVTYLTINLQLDYWKLAVEAYRTSTTEGNIPTYADFDKVILFLGVSLSRLFGRNWTDTDRRIATPTIKRLANTTIGVLPTLRNSRYMFPAKRPRPSASLSTATLR